MRNYILCYMQAARKHNQELGWRESSIRRVEHLVIHVCKENNEGFVGLTFVESGCRGWLIGVTWQQEASVCWLLYRLFTHSFRFSAQTSPFRLNHPDVRGDPLRPRCSQVLKAPLGRLEDPTTVSGTLSRSLYYPSDHRVANVSWLR